MDKQDQEDFLAREYQVEEEPRAWEKIARSLLADWVAHPIRGVDGPIVSPWTDEFVREQILEWDPTEAECYDEIAAHQAAVYLSAIGADPEYVSPEDQMSEVYHTYDILKFTRNNE
jgi:hypothetical protein